MTRFSFSVCLLFIALFSHPVTAAGARETGSNNLAESCVRMNVSASDLASFGEKGRQHYRIVFENQCESMRIVYWCAEHPSRTLTIPSLCKPSAAREAAVAAPLYAVTRQREFQWTFPPGTRIHFVDCGETAVPTSDFRCKSTKTRP